MALTRDELEHSFFRQVADGYDGVRDATVAAVRGAPGAHEYVEDQAALEHLRHQLGGDTRAFEVVLNQRLQSLSQSFFSALDGAFADTEEERVLAVGLNGEVLDPGLNERWIDFLWDTGRAGD